MSVTWIPNSAHQESFLDTVLGLQVWTQPKLFLMLIYLKNPSNTATH